MRGLARVQTPIGLGFRLQTVDPSVLGGQDLGDLQGLLVCYLSFSNLWAFPLRDMVS